MDAKQKKLSGGGIFRRILLGLGLLALIGFCLYLTAQSWRANYHLGAAEQALTANRLEQAKAHLLLCLELQPNHVQAHFLLAQTARRTGNDREALAYLEKAEQLNGVPEAVELERTLLRVQNGDLTPAQDALLWAYVKKGHPGAVLILEALTKGYMKTFRLGQAQESLEEWLERQPENIQALSWRGRVLRHLKGDREAAAVFQKIVQLDPDNASARLDLAQTLLDINQPRQAVEQFQWLAEREPGHAGAVLGLAQGRRLLGQIDQARSLLAGLLQQFPDHAKALAERGRLELEAGNWDQAETFLTRAVARTPFDRDAVYNYLRCLERRQDKVAAAKWRSRLQQIDDGLKRLAVLTQKITQAPREAGPRCEAGKIFLSIGNDQEGLRWLASALHEDPNHLESHKVLHDYYGDKGRLDLAARHAQALANSSPPTLGLPKKR